MSQEAPIIFKSPPPARERIRRLLTVVSAGYLAGLLSLLISMEWIGERNWVLSVLLYVPAHFWFLPMWGLIPCALLVQPRLSLWLAGGGLAAFLLFTPYHWSRRPSPPKPGSITLLTNNIANSNHWSVQPFIREQNPDIVALQEAPHRQLNYSKEFPDRFVAQYAQFLVLSKYPILSATSVPGAVWRGSPVAAKFELSVNGKRLIVYNVHLPTPRSDFGKLAGPGLARETLGPGWNRKRSDGMSYRESMEARVALAENLARRISMEQLPFVLMGDFNMPDRGYIHRLFSSRFADAFAVSGRGWGRTFPGFGSHGFGMLGPWLRIDYLFAGKGWKPVDCKTEPDRRSKHRAVVACFEPE